ncbi:MAG: prenyltransferase/squalene oxidase repeat-containing protein [Isosphaeraceae bacterium]|nr:prenyltransferase/squalene oxidase repeat-containing protein [Isosphaeraceae bacterium]
MNSRRHFLRASATATSAVVWGWSGMPVSAQSTGASPEAMSARAVGFLKPRQDEQGAWSAQRGPGITALVVTAMLRSKRVTPSDPAVVKGLGFLESFLSPKGGFAEGPTANYVTAIALMAFHEANVDGRYKARIAAAQNYLKGLQWDESEGKTPSDPFYGGAGYGSKSRPDLSNTSFFLDALRDTGLPADDPALRKALVFVSRTQNLAGEFNDQPWAGKVNDGGFIYTPALGGVSMADEPNLPNGGLRSYASMTYAGLKSMIHAGLTRDDPRVKAALRFIREHYTLDENPGLGQSGLFYYYQTFAKALAMYGDAKLVDAAGKEHDWRLDLVAALAKRQAADGSWVNPADRFMEGDPNLVTSYALLALAYARPKA